MEKFDNEYSSVSFSSACRNKAQFPKPNKYTVKLPHTMERVQQIRLGTLELPTQIQPNVVKNENDAFAVQEEGTQGKNPIVTMILPEAYYSAKELVMGYPNTGLMNQLLNHGDVNMEEGTFVVFYSKNNVVQDPVFISINSTEHARMYERAAVLRDINDAFTASPADHRSNLFEAFCTLKEDGHFQFNFLRMTEGNDTYNIDSLDFRQTSQIYLNLLGLKGIQYYPERSDKQLYQPIGSPGYRRLPTQTFFPTYNEYTIKADSASPHLIVTVDLTEHEAFYTNACPMIAVQETNEKTWNMRCVEAITSDADTPGRFIITLSQDPNVLQGLGVDQFPQNYLVLAGAKIRLFPELVNMYTFSAAEQKFNILVNPTTDSSGIADLPYCTVIAQKTTARRLLGIGDVNIQSNANMEVVFPHQYHVDPPPYILLYLTNLACRNRHMLLHDTNDDDVVKQRQSGFQPLQVTTPLAKIIQRSAFHINRNQIMELDLAGVQNVSHLSLEFRNPDGSPVNFQNRDHHMTIGFVRKVRQLYIGTNY